MSYVCKFCLARRWKDKPAGMYCASGKVRLPELQLPPALLLTYLSGEPADSAEFFKNIRRYNSVFQMTSFGGKVCMGNAWMPTFKVQGQIYHQIRSLMPAAVNMPPKFLQLYFVGNTDAEVDARCNIFGVGGDGKPKLNRNIVAFRNVLHQYNPYIWELKEVVQ